MVGWAGPQFEEDAVNHICPQNTILAPKFGGSRSEPFDRVDV